MSDTIAQATPEPIRLTYVKGHGLAEQARWLLSASGDEWEQVGFETNAEFLKLQTDGKLLFNQVPLLEIDGLNLVQGQAMMRYLSRRGGLDGKTDAEKVHIDMVCENIKDLCGPAGSLAWTDDKEAVHKKANDLVTKFFPHLEKLLVKNNGQFVESGLSTADICLAEMVHNLVTDGKLVSEEVLATYPSILAMYQRVVALPGIATYLGSNKRYSFPHGVDGLALVENVKVTLFGKAPETA